MMTLTIQLSEDLEAKAQARAAEAGHASLPAYLESLLRADVELSHANGELPERVTVRSMEELEAKLAEGFDSPAREVTPDEWEAEQIRRLTERHVRSRAG